MALPEEDPVRPLWQNAVFFALLVAILVFANWGKPAVQTAPGLPSTAPSGQSLLRRPPRSP